MSVIGNLLSNSGNIYLVVEVEPFNFYCLKFWFLRFHILRLNPIDFLLLVLRSFCVKCFIVINWLYFYNWVIHITFKMIHFRLRWAWLFGVSVFWSSFIVLLVIVLDGSVWIFCNFKPLLKIAIWLSCIKSKWRSRYLGVICANKLFIVKIDCFRITFFKTRKRLLSWRFDIFLKFQIAFGYICNAWFSERFTSYFVRLKIIFYKLFCFIFVELCGMLQMYRWHFL